MATRMGLKDTTTITKQSNLNLFPDVNAIAVVG
jgi:hypothetical protein